jgi:mRNA interferase MazF
MKKGEIWNADLRPSKGSEQAGFRRVVIVSGNLLNENMPVVIVMPLTSKIKNYKGNPVLIPSAANGLKVSSEVLVFHIRSISKNRLIEKLGVIEGHELLLTTKTLNDVLKY